MCSCHMQGTMFTPSAADPFELTSGGIIFIHTGRKKRTVGGKIRLRSSTPSTGMYVSLSRGLWVINGFPISDSHFILFFIQAWLHGEGLSLPIDIPYDTTLANDAYLLAQRWNDSKTEDVGNLEFSQNDLDSFNSNQKGFRACVSKCCRAY